MVAAGLAAAAAAAIAAAPALGAFPYTRPGADPRNYQDLYLTDQVPNDVGDDDDGEYFKYSASPLAGERAHQPPPGRARRRPRRLACSTSTRRCSTGPGRSPPAGPT